ncbi:MAG: heparan-sulfate lyase [Candidatus Latescibacterota bacterium]|jgi:heparan-sulfate lyase
MLGETAIYIKEHLMTELRSLKPEDILTVLDLSGEGLAKVKTAADAGDRLGALSALLDHYRATYPLTDVTANPATIVIADNVVNHTFQRVPYEPVNYGAQIDWEWDPQNDIEWVATVFRFYWAPPLAHAFAATGDDRYVQAFVELASDWISKYPLEKHEETHSKYTHWKGFAWLDIQTGRRASSIFSSFKMLIHGKSFTPEFLGVLLASLYDHQVKTEHIPMNKIHNKAVFEQRGFMNIATLIPEFKDTARWLEMARQRTEEIFLAQVTTDGVQREWSYGYHNGVLNDAKEILAQLATAGIAVSDVYKERIRLMHDYIFAVATPDLGAPMYGDGSRPLIESDDRSTWPLYDTLMEATAYLDDAKYAARAVLDGSQLPSQTSYAFPEAGMYVLRNEWGTDAIHMGLHCSPLAISGHDHPDNGTFELYGYGRWLMPDSGFYVYGHDAEARAWHRQTSVHQTLTLDGNDSVVDGRHLLWHSDDAFDAVVVENLSYEGLTHRRTIWFVDRRFYVLLDEAIGDASGVLDLHFQFAPGDVAVEGNSAHTQFDDANVLVQAADNVPVSITQEAGWFAWQYGFRTERQAIRLAHDGQAPAAFLSLVIPYKGTDAPDASINLPDGFVVGADRVELSVRAFGHEWHIARDLSAQTASCQLMEG